MSGYLIKYRARDRQESTVRLLVNVDVIYGVLAIFETIYEAELNSYIEVTQNDNKVTLPDNRVIATGLATIVPATSEIAWTETLASLGKTDALIWDYTLLLTSSGRYDIYGFDSDDFLNGIYMGLFMNGVRNFDHWLLRIYRGDDIVYYVDESSVRPPSPMIVETVKAPTLPRSTAPTLPPNFPPSVPLPKKIKVKHAKIQPVKVPVEATIVETETTIVEVSGLDRLNRQPNIKALPVSRTSPPRRSTGPKITKILPSFIKSTPKTPPAPKEITSYRDISSTGQTPRVNVEEIRIPQASQAKGYFIPTRTKRPANFNRMTNKELTQYAQAEGIELRGARRKADIIAAILKSQGK